MKASFSSTDILLPKQNIAIDKWAVIACDQYTSQPEYWEKVADYVKDEPSTLHMIYPEVYLEEAEPQKRIDQIQSQMKRYLDEGVLETGVSNGFILVERQVGEKVRLGIVGKLDLDAYDYDPSKKNLIRATEQTITSRIPPRVRIRQGAVVESPHIMLLMDDAQKKVIEPLYERRSDLKCLYDTTLMLNGGFIRGYAIEDEEAEKLDNMFLEIQNQCDGLFLVVGDGNHSLATAKTCWENIKQTLSKEERENHPARYALVELVNLHDISLEFEPIHRAIFNGDANELIEEFLNHLKRQNIEVEEGNDIVFWWENCKRGMALKHTGNRIPVEVLQQFLDEYLQKNRECTIDYIHGMDALLQLVAKEGCIGIELGAISKESLFPAIREGFVLPRKTFSMGEAHEKRYYLECRKVAL